MADHIAGYTVLTDDKAGNWDLNWDGELFVDIDAAQESAAKARESGWKTALAEVRILEEWEARDDD